MCKELIINLVFKVMKPRLQANKRYFKLPSEIHSLKIWVAKVLKITYAAKLLGSAVNPKVFKI